jgi:Xaa-Pro aminopeptidase
MNQIFLKLFLAEQKAKELFKAVEERELIVPGKSESELTMEIASLATRCFGITKYWHKKIVRTGVNTLHPYNGDPPDRVIQKDDILFLDFGLVFDGWEADLGRTYVLGNDPIKLKLKNDVESAWRKANDWICTQTRLTGAACFHYVTAMAKTYGWEFGGEIAGHIVGRFPHEQLVPGDWGLDIHPDNHKDILVPVKDAPRRPWILEIHFVDKKNKIGAFHEQLLRWTEEE